MGFGYPRIRAPNGRLAEPLAGTSPSVTHARTTVVIATRNRRTSLSRSLEKLTALRPRPPIIVLDNASNDGTGEAVRAFDQVRLIRLPRNAGAAARNIGVRWATTPYVAFSDDDSWWAPDALARAEQIMDATPTLGLLAAETVIEPSGRRDPVSALMAASPLGHDPDLPGPSVLGFLACAAIVRRRAYLHAGGFSPVLHFAGEEALLAYDLAARGWALCYVDGVRAHHHPWPQRPDLKRRNHLQLRNGTLIAWMRRPAGEAVRAAAALLRAPLRDPAAAIAVLGALRRLPAALARRDPLPGDVEARVRLLDHHGWEAT
jgi:glycosyltransferase involved in cell wall biosynthesis